MAQDAPKSGLLIHLGNNKTGSTSLQMFLSKNEQALRGKSINFVRTGRRHISHNRIYRDMRGAGAREIWEAVAQEITGAPDTLHLMSSEMFFDRHVAQNMIHFMPVSLRAQTRLVVYLRRQDNYLEAMFKQLTKNGRFSATPQDFVESHGRELASYADILMPFEEAVGPEAIVVRPFERSRLKNGDVTADFLGLLGLGSDDPGFVPPERAANETLSRAATQMLGALTRHGPLNAREIAREMLRGDDDPPRRSGDVFCKAERQAIMAEYAAQNSSIAARYLPDDGTPTLFSTEDLQPDAPDPYPSPEEEVALYAAAQEKVAAAIGRIAAQDRAKLFRG